LQFLSLFAHDPFGKPVPTPIKRRGRAFSRIMREAGRHIAVVRPLAQTAPPVRFPALQPCSITAGNKKAPAMPGL
jgi:hypothetical protein